MKVKDLIERLENDGIEEEKPLFVVTKGQAKINAFQNQVQRKASELMYLVREIDGMPAELKKIHKGNAEYAGVKKDVESILDKAASEVEEARRNLGEANATLIKAIKALKDVV